MKTVTFIFSDLASRTVSIAKAEGYQFTTVVNEKVRLPDRYLLVLCHYLFHSSPASGKRVNLISETRVSVRIHEPIATTTTCATERSIGQGSITPVSLWLHSGRYRTEEVYSGINYNSPTHNHKELAGYGSASPKRTAPAQSGIRQANQEPVRHLDGDTA